jgi:hypothetical protein
MKYLSIISRYEEDINWAVKLETDITVYNKSKSWPFSFPRLDVENHGREAETYVRGIIDYYENLDEYSHMIFLQGNPFEHCKDILKFINDGKFSENKTLYLADFISSDKYNDENFIYNHHVSILNILLQNKNTSNHSLILDKRLIDGNQIGIQHNDFLYEETMALCTIMGIEYKGKETFWANGAQYVVPIKYIKNKSIDWWKNLHSLIVYFSKEKNRELAFGLERIWGLIWEHECI